MSSFFYTVKTYLNITLSYRMEVLGGILSNFVIMVATVFFWKSAYINTEQVAGVTGAQMSVYAVVVTILSVLFYCSVGDELGSRIRDGNIALDMLKPLNIYIFFLAQDMGNLLSALLLKAIPLFLISLLFIPFTPPVSVAAYMCFFLSIILSYAILWLTSALVGLLTFWAMHVGPLGFVKDVIVRILSGSLIPIWFLPDWLQRLINFTPFVYTYQLTAGVYIGKISVNQALEGNLLQLLWIGILLLLFILLKKRAFAKVLVQGG